MHITQEERRLAEIKTQQAPWRRFGPYLSERQWGTVREDYSPDGNAWNYVTHDMARSYAYRWGEEGIGGVSDEKQLLCLSVALWNGQDDILKERLFGLTNGQGNHGEDVKECYYYLDNTPSHAYMKMLYKYPQRRFPYQRLLTENARRSRNEPEYELIDTDIFSKGRYHDVFIEHAKAGPEDLLMRITVHNRGPRAARLQVLPQLWFRNTWSWGNDDYKPQMRAVLPGVVEVEHRDLGRYWLYCDANPDLLFCDNDTNPARIEGDYPPPPDHYYKDGIHEYVVEGDLTAVNPARRGTKVAANYYLTVPAGGSRTVRVRLSNQFEIDAFSKFDDVLGQRQREADEFYTCLHDGIAGEDACNVYRQALAGMLWSKQFYYYDVSEWLRGDPNGQPSAKRLTGRNSNWQHLRNADIVSMPDKWEYPWYAAWDLAFHCLPLAMVDPEFAKDQLRLLTRDWYLHPNGQMPAYEWNFGDVNPPVHAWATWRVYQMDKKRNNGQGDREFLETVFHRLMLNFTWWVNRKDRNDRNIFEGGFLGLDNIGVFDRSAPLPTGGHIEQADGTSWMAMYALNLMRIALELAETNPVYQDIAGKFFEHFLYIAEAMTRAGDGAFNLWDDEDEFFYDVLHLPDGERSKLKVRSIVGLIPLFAVEVLDEELLNAMPTFSKRLNWIKENRPHLAQLVSSWEESGRAQRHRLSLLRTYRLRKLLTRMLDETEFLGEFGIRALSRHHLDEPYVFRTLEADFTVTYLPGESDSDLFGGNSNWRGPIWFPINYLIIESLQRFYAYYGDNFRIEYPTGSGQEYNLREVAAALAGRLNKLLLRDEHGQRPAFGNQRLLQHDPHFKDYLLFHEYFHGDTGLGLGASHQTGWTGLIARLLQIGHPEIASVAPVPTGG